MKLFGIKRERADSEQIANLDAMVMEPVSFRLLGRDHILRPLSLEQFLRVTKAWKDMESLRDEKGLSVSSILDKYYEVIRSATDSVSRDDLDRMSTQQIGALLQLITETVTGKTFAEKKTLPSHLVAWHLSSKSQN